MTSLGSTDLFGDGGRLVLCRILDSSGSICVSRLGLSIADIGRHTQSPGLRVGVGSIPMLEPNVAARLGHGGGRGDGGEAEGEERKTERKTERKKTIEMK